MRKREIIKIMSLQVGTLYARKIISLAIALNALACLSEMWDGPGGLLGLWIIPIRTQ